MRSSFKANVSLSDVLDSKKRGRKSALDTHPETIDQFHKFLDLEASSQKSTVRRLKKVDDVQELIQPMYILSASSGLQKKVKAGGGVSEKGKLSASTLRKHVSPRYRPLIAQSMVCGDCHQRKKSIAVLNSALDADSSVFM